VDALVHVTLPALVMAMRISVRNSVDVTLHGVGIDSKGVNASVVSISIKGALLVNVHAWRQAESVTLICANYASLRCIIPTNLGINAIILESGYVRNVEC
jgi:hypothetical protein